MLQLLPVTIGYRRCEDYLSLRGAMQGVLTGISPLTRQDKQADKTRRLSVNPAIARKSFPATSHVN